MAMSVTEFRANAYRIVDQVIASGQPVEIERNGTHLLITVLKGEAKPAKNKLENLKAHPDCIVGDPEDLVAIDWSKEWSY